jgi:uncharacterized protein YndB with AHSA1/START domain
MAFTSRIIDAPAGVVWAALIDPSTYPDWLIGTREVREIESDWPAIGSGFHHSVGVPPLVLRDRTHITAILPGRRLELAVKARPLVSACARFELVSDGDRTVVTLEEEPAHRVIGNLVRPVLDVATHHRNHRSLRNLDDLLTGERAQRADHTGNGSP